MQWQLRHTDCVFHRVYLLVGEDNQKDREREKMALKEIYGSRRILFQRKCLQKRVCVCVCVCTHDLPRCGVPAGGSPALPIAAFRDERRVWLLESRKKLNVCSWPFWKEQIPGVEATARQHLWSLFTGTNKGCESRIDEPLLQLSMETNNPIKLGNTCS